MNKKLLIVCVSLSSLTGCPPTYVAPPQGDTTANFKESPGFQEEEKPAPIINQASPSNNQNPQNSEY
ncbi:MAG: hypothetical protein M0R33_10485 [Methylomonas sp.]|jgi:hypothetical protein|uniref:hypothetical protein n=1 Tax=Methylomonas sp. TaxID=418 RepID=UPI0025F423F2|nr:hypothetical protein [Methylomonas sp.]MCK9606856.1 hypothetical protein [Methylomonas sp.]